MEIIGKIYTGFTEKFGIPRQSGLADTDGQIRLMPPYNDREVVRGLEEFSHIWLIWGFSMCSDDQWSSTVRPPRLGGNRRVGVFATRSPFRPNHMGLSCVELVKITYEKGTGPVIHVKGADLMDGTPIYDIKPYVPYADMKPDAKGGFANEKPDESAVVTDCSIPQGVTPQILKEIRQLIAQDPRPAYADDPQRIYGMKYKGMEIKFRGEKNKITICHISFLPAL